jgi:isochorismate pyruvate lyase
MAAPDVVACTSLEEVRERIDSLDAELVRLLGQRFAYARQAAEFKTSAAEVPAPARVERVIANIRALAVEHGAPVDAVERAYRVLIEAMIALELDLHRGRGGGKGSGASKV